MLEDTNSLDAVHMIILLWAEELKHNIVTDGIMMIQASDQVLCDMWSNNFYDAMLHTT